MSISREVVLCHNCKGTGVIHRSELTCYHKREYDEWYDNCKTCNGTGLLTKTTTVQFEPYIKPETKD